MRRLPAVLLCTFVTVGALVDPGALNAAPDGDGGYVVEPGDYLLGIAQRHGVTLGALLRANQLGAADVIHPGQRLTIPGSAPAAPAPPPSSGGGTYTVRSGDYLFGIAKRLGVPIRSLLAVNRLSLSSVIHPGQRLAIPGSGAAPRSSAGGGTYTVRSGDSLFGIARRLGVPIRSLLAVNRLSLSSVIHPGQRLAIPAGDRSAPARGRPTPSAVAQIIRDVWPDHLEQKALAIAWRESRYQPDARSRCCVGLFQLYFDVHKGWLADLGVSRNDLLNPRTNAKAAYALYQRAGGWSPWSLASG